MAHMGYHSAGDVPPDGTPAKKSDRAPADKEIADHLRCGHPHLMDRAQHAQIVLPVPLTGTRFTLGDATSFDNTNPNPPDRSEEHTSELQSLMRISYAVFCLKKKKNTKLNTKTPNTNADQKIIPRKTNKACKT